MIGLEILEKPFSIESIIYLKSCKTYGKFLKVY